METMAEAVIQCVKGASFGEQYLDVFHGPNENEWIFDEKQLKMFLSM